MPSQLRIGYFIPGIIFSTLGLAPFPFFGSMSAQDMINAGLTSMSIAAIAFLATARRALNARPKAREELGIGFLITFGVCILESAACALIVQTPSALSQTLAHGL